MGIPVNNKVLLPRVVVKHLLSVAFFVALLSCPSIASAELYKVRTENGVRLTTLGDSIRYSLYIPVASPDMPTPPWPLVILNHGFGRERRYHSKNAYYMAEHGIIVFTPDMVSLVRGEAAQLRNIDNSVDHLLWLLERSASAGDRIEGFIDTSRIGFAGHSAGAAVSLEAVVEAQTQGIPVAALCLLDASPWQRTRERTPDLKPLRLVSLRSDRSLCTAAADVASLLKQVSFPSEDIHILGAGHCDPENPTNWLCTLVCGQNHKGQQEAYQRLMFLFFKDAFSMPSAEDSSETLEGLLSNLTSEGKIKRNSLPGKREYPCCGYRDRFEAESDVR